MKYGYEGADYSKLIRYYEVINDQIFIEYFNGNYEYRPFSIEEEKKVLEEMLEQARERDKKVSIETIEHNIRKFESRIYTLIGLAVLKVPFVINGDIPNSVKFGLSLLICLESFLALDNNRTSSFYREHISEFKKYRTYLNMIDELKKCNKEVDCIKVGSGDDTLRFDVNTLDYYSLEEVQSTCKQYTNK